MGPGTPTHDPILDHTIEGPTGDEDEETIPLESYAQGAPLNKITRHEKMTRREERWSLISERLYPASERRCLFASLMGHTWL